MFPATALAIAAAVTAVLLAGPVSAWVARAGWGDRAPRSTLLLFQALCLSAGLCLIGAGLVVSLRDQADSVAGGLVELVRHAWDGVPLAGMTGSSIVVLTLTGVVTVALTGALCWSLVQAVRRRRGHRMLLDLLTGGQDDRRSPDDILAGVRVLDHPGAVAYTLPGWHSRVVLSAGLVDLLSKEELAAVVAHERAHVRSRHDLLVLPFQTWTTVLGRLPGVRAAADRVAELTEMLADDDAARRTSPRVLATALVAVATAGVPQEGALGGITPAVAGRAVAGRVTRLLRPVPPTPLLLALVYLATAVLLAIPLVGLFLTWS